MSEKMTKEQLASRLNLREYGSEITKDEEKQAKESGLVVVFGYSDYNAEMRGAIYDEVGCNAGGIILLLPTGKVLEEDHDCECDYCGYKEMQEIAKKIEAVWGSEGYSWIYKTDIPHATFDIMEENNKFCRGIVFNFADLQ